MAERRTTPTAGRRLLAGPSGGPCRAPDSVRRDLPALRDRRPARLLRAGDGEAVVEEQAVTRTALRAWSRWSSIVPQLKGRQCRHVAGCVRRDGPRQHRNGAVFDRAFRREISWIPKS